MLLLSFQAWSPSGSTLYVCDTNHHQIKAVDLDTNCISVVPIHQLTSAIDDDYDGAAAGNELVVNVGLDPTGGSVELSIQLNLPSGSKLNSDAPSSWRVLFPNKSWNLEAGNGIDGGTISRPDFVIKIKCGQADTLSIEKVRINMNLFLCNDADGVCSVAKKSLAVSVAPQHGIHDIAKSVNLSLTDK